ncbi:MAG: amidohydrolase, partial [Bryobacteraceae bacterium]|nr:amidohydrolase [Bryobacteraceae bacterium]
MVRTLVIQVLLAALTSGAAFAQVAVVGETVYTMAGAPLKNGVVLIDGSGRIQQVGSAAEIKTPSGYKVLRAKVVTPGLIDAHTVVGFTGYLNQPQDQEQVERSASEQPELRAIDGYDAR